MYLCIHEWDMNDNMTALMTVWQSAECRAVNNTLLSLVHNTAIQQSPAMNIFDYKSRTKVCANFEISLLLHSCLSAMLTVSRDWPHKWLAPAAAAVLCRTLYVSMATIYLECSGTRKHWTVMSATVVTEMNHVWLWVISIVHVAALKGLVA